MDSIARGRLFGLGLAASFSLGTLAVRPTGPLLAQEVALPKRPPASAARPGLMTPPGRAER